MDSIYDFDAPQFLDLRDGNNDCDDNFFNCKMNNENASNEKNRRVVFAQDEKENAPKYSLGCRIKTPIVQKVHKPAENDADELLDKIKSLNIGSKATPGRKPLRASQIFEGIELIPESAKKHKMITRADSITRTPMLSLRNRSIPKAIESEDEADDSMMSAVSSTTELTLPDNNRHYYKRSTSMDCTKTDVQPRKFVALAEQVARFHKETPDRYRTKPHQPWRPSMIKPRLLIPKGPNLTSMSRSRQSHFPDRQQREQQEYEEMLKHQIKANPVNEKILKQVSLGLKAPIEKRAITCIQPFHLTEYHKPKPVESEPVFKFKAQPAPTRILQSPVGIPPKKIIPATTPKTPAITMPVRVRVPTPRINRESGMSTESLPRNTKIEPFSFEQRDRLMLARKEENIKKIIEEEKKVCNSFKAQPIRKFSEKLTTPMKARIEPKKTTTPMPFNLTKIKPQERKEPEIPQFKANPATVLIKRPFFPVHPNHTAPKIQEFKLKTEERVEKWKKFEEKVQQTEAEMLKAKQEAQEKEEKKKQEELKELRKNAEFKANPIPKLKAFQIHASNTSLTQPISPCFRSGKTGKKTDV